MKIRIDKTLLLFILLTLPHFNPLYLQQFEQLEIAINIGRVISSVVVMILVISRISVISKVSYLLLLMEAYIVLNTFIQSGNVSDAILKSMSVICVGLLYEYAVHIDGDAFIKSQMICFEIAIYINLITIILYPNGLYTYFDDIDRHATVWRNWFLGYYTSFAEYCIPAVMFAFLYKKKFGNGVRAYLLVIAAALNMILTWAGAGMISILSMILVFVFFKSKDRLFNYINYWIMLILFYVAIIMLKLQNLFMWFIQNVLKKSSSFQVRVDLWEATRDRIHESIFFGYGQEYALARRRRIYNVLFGDYGHNIIIEVMYTGGLVYLILFFSIVLIVGFKLTNNRDFEIVQIISIGFLGWCLNSMTGASMTPFLVGMFIVAYNFEYLENINVALLYNS